MDILSKSELDSFAELYKYFGDGWHTYDTFIKSAFHFDYIEYRVDLLLQECTAIYLFLGAMVKFQL